MSAASKGVEKCLWFSVSLPRNADEWDWISVMYGYTPFVWIGFVFVVLLWRRRDTRQLSYLLQPAFVLLMNEIIKHIVKQPRPEGACGASTGMPSSHSALSIGSITAVTLDLITTPPTRATLAADTVVWSFMFLVLLPVPVSRVVLGDHSVQQTLAGCFSGMLFGSLWFWLLLQLRQYTAKYLGEPLWRTFIIHNYAPVNFIKDEEETEVNRQLKDEATVGGRVEV